MTKKLLSILFLLFFFMGLQAQSDTTKVERLRIIKGGIRIQKTQKLYWENGFTLDLACNRIHDYRIHFGLSYVSSRLGSAMGSNAIKQDNYIFSTAYHFRSKKHLQPIVRLNIGYFYADYEDPIFDVLPNTSLIFGLAVGLAYEFDFPLTVSLNAGYTLTAGNGSSGPGTLYPIYYQMSVYYTIFDQSK